MKTPNESPLVSVSLTIQQWEDIVKALDAGRRAADRASFDADRRGDASSCCTFLETGWKCSNAADLLHNAARGVNVPVFRI